MTWPGVNPTPPSPVADTRSLYNEMPVFLRRSYDLGSTPPPSPLTYGRHLTTIPWNASFSKPLLWPRVKPKTPLTCGRHPTTTPWNASFPKALLWLGLWSTPPSPPHLWQTPDHYTTKCQFSKALLWPGVKPPPPSPHLWQTPYHEMPVFLRHCYDLACGQPPPHPLTCGRHPITIPRNASFLRRFYDLGSNPPPPPLTCGRHLTMKCQFF